MKIPVWCLVVLLGCFFTPARCDCQGECVACGLLLQQQQLEEAFDTIVCLLECEGHVSTSLTWEVCRRAVKLSHQPTLAEGGALFKRAGEEPDLTPLDLNAESAAAQQLPEQDQDETPWDNERSVQYDSSPLGSSEEGGSLRGLDVRLTEEEAQQRRERGSESDGQLEGDASSEGVTLSKRFGGFQRGRHGYRKLIGSPVRGLQKRYGGFIGVRKSARQWNSPKWMNVNQQLRYRSSSRSGRPGTGGLPTNRRWRQSKL
ncbi:prepronociceptin b [Xiphophorus hellerii]|uniref:prepronociceptin b n=1 Tax=Xiphophorus hellerii TaxID=8084 RepID=UPI0013B4017D|nr:proenkephalin-A-like [Xiphophorus hellerii]